MLSGAANFNKLASTQYKLLDTEDKEALKALSSKTTNCAPMMPKEIKRNASKIFKRIRIQVSLTVSWTYLPQIEK